MPLVGCRYVWMYPTLDLYPGVVMRVDDSVGFVCGYLGRCLGTFAASTIGTLSMSRTLLRRTYARLRGIMGAHSSRMACGLVVRIGYLTIGGCQ